MRRAAHPAVVALASVLASAATGCADDCVRVAITHVEPGGGETTAMAVCVERAVTADERRRGLAGHPPLAAGEGLLIELPIQTEVCIVNVGVTFAIDAVYVAEDAAPAADGASGTVVAGAVVAVERAIPAGDPDARCHESTRWVIETRSGESIRVEPGDRVAL